MDVPVLHLSTQAWEEDWASCFEYSQVSQY